MNIDPISSYNISMQGLGWNSAKKTAKNGFRKAVQFVIDLAPSITAKGGETIAAKRNRINDLISRPMENRIINGALALMTVPIIDYNNHKVDDETRGVAVCRTLAKILAGTAVGCVVRGSVFKFIEKATQLEGKTKFSQLFLPKRLIREMRANETFFKNHRNVISMVAALGVMTFTNFLCDAPLTVFLTNIFNKFRKTEKTAAAQKASQLIEFDPAQINTNVKNNPFSPNNAGLVLGVNEGENVNSAREEARYV